ncbi:hypothetical protein OL229_01565 [Neisseriaceae bacterium JH1-16]|nr:hypothetical protein [Neisseriaceae bacterium JH1-16]
MRSTSPPSKVADDGAGQQRNGLAKDFAIWPMVGRPLACLFFKPMSEPLQFCAKATAEQCNGFGTLHGGFLAAMGDIWLGTTSRLGRPKRHASSPPA